MLHSNDVQQPCHPTLTRRGFVEAGAASILGLGMAELNQMRALAAPDAQVGRAKSVIFIFAVGGMSQLETFDMKPDAPDSIRGEFRPISTSVPGIQICEHLPMLARQAHQFALVRSVSHPETRHRQGCMIMQSGRTSLPLGYKNVASRRDWPSIASLAGFATKSRSQLPNAMLLPEMLYYNATIQVPGQTAGMLGFQHDPWLVEATQECKGNGYPTRGACPDCFNFGQYYKPHKHTSDPLFETPRLQLSPGMSDQRLAERQLLLSAIDGQRRDLEKFAKVADFDRNRERVISLLTDGQTRNAFDVFSADAKVLDRYGQNKFGWSLLMARRLVEAGVNVIQVNLGHNFTWDTHGEQFPELKDRLLPPADRAISALLDDLAESGLLDETLVVMASEFGRTPKVFKVKGSKNPGPGRGHWGPVQTVLFAGGGVRGGTVVGASDNQGGYPIADRHSPEDFAATVYDALGIPPTAAWKDNQNRPHYIYHGQPIAKLT